MIVLAVLLTAWVIVPMLIAFGLIGTHLYCDWRSRQHIGFFIEREHARDNEDREVAMLENWLALPCHDRRLL